MRRFQHSQVDLFGQETNDDICLGEVYLITQYLIEDDEFIDRADWALKNVLFAHNILLDLEDHALLDEALKAYIFGLYASVILAADAFCERILTDAIEIRGNRSAAKSGFGSVLGAAEKLRIVNCYILKRISRLHRLRTNLGHEKGPDHELRLSRRALDDRRSHTEILKQDAKEALCLMNGVAAHVPRYFPRLEFRGHESIAAELPKL